MKTQITELKNQITAANSATVEGRQMIAKACKDLYNLIEEDFFLAGAEWMLRGLYTDLCTGNFAEPFMAERKKNDFNISLTVYQERILPRL